LRLVDLFAGLGGTSEGARMAGLSVLRAANHWGSAVEYHALNHPAVAHDLQDLQQANFYEYPDFDILAASPACQGHSHAKGKERFHHDAARSTAWAVVACAEAKRPPYLVVENVAAFTRWRLYPQWRSCLESLGYRLTENLLDAADCGVPQNRVRLFLVGALGGEVKVRPGTKPHVPALATHRLDGRELVASWPAWSGRLDAGPRHCGTPAVRQDVLSLLLRLGFRQDGPQSRPPAGNSHHP
jgi:DNA (cytosine-5)-methyltransferase 1